MWSPSIIPLIFFPPKTDDLFFAHHIIDFTARLNSHDTHTDSAVSITPKQIFAGPLVGTLLVGTPVRPNMLNMPKSSSIRWPSYYNAMESG